MNVLHINNYDYKGGAETVFRTTSEITGVQNTFGFVPTGYISEKPHILFKDWENKNKLLALVNYVFSYHNYRILYKYLLQTPIGVIHLHGFFSSLSPSILLAIKKAKQKRSIKIIQTLHDFHLVCPNSSLYNFRTERLCEKCIGKKHKLSIIVDGCDRRGYIPSLAKGIRSFVSNNILKHRAIVDTFICPSEFLREKLLEDGVDRKKVVIIRNPVNIDTRGIALGMKKNIICYFGRFSKEKNLEFLIDAFGEWRVRMNKDFQLHLIGEGEEEKTLKELALRNPAAPSIIFKEYLPPTELNAYIANVKYLSLTSRCYENAPMTVLESIAMNIIPLVPNIGGMNESVASFTHIGKTFQINNKESWIQSIEHLENNYERELDNLIRRKEKVFEEIAVPVYYEKIHDLYTEPST